MKRLRPALLGLLAGTDPTARLDQDPLAFVRRYRDPHDIELAAVFASGLAYGRVAAFWPVLEALFAQVDHKGGPRAWVEHFDQGDANALAPVRYRWMLGEDLALLARTLQAAVRRHGSLGAIFVAATDHDQPDVGPALDQTIGQLRAFALGVSGHSDWKALRRGFRYFLPRPADGSACKRWNLALRWLVRPPGSGADGVDLGVWDVPPRQLVIPLDTHVMRVAWFIGLTARRDASWRTARQITDNLARLDADDPVRFDFALAHLGISGDCHGKFVPDVCGACALRTVCRMVG